MGARSDGGPPFSDCRIIGRPADRAPNLRTYHIASSPRPFWEAEHESTLRQQQLRSAKTPFFQTFPLLLGRRRGSIHAYKSGVVTKHEPSEVSARARNLPRLVLFYAAIRIDDPARNRRGVRASSRLAARQGRATHPKGGIMSPKIAPGAMPSEVCRSGHVALREGISTQAGAYYTPRRLRLRLRFNDLKPQAHEPRHVPRAHRRPPHSTRPNDAHEPTRSRTKPDRSRTMRTQWRTIRTRLLSPRTSPTFRISRLREPLGATQPPSFVPANVFSSTRHGAKPRRPGGTRSPPSPRRPA